MTIDIATGLPELPEGQFWRVTELCYTGIQSNVSVWGHLVQIIESVTYRREIKRWFSREPITHEYTEQRLVSSQRIDGVLNEENIRTAAEQLVSKLAEVLAEEERKERLIGDYPPKKLEVSK